jgi:hypothetical protein
VLAEDTAEAGVHELGRAVIFGDRICLGPDVERQHGCAIDLANEIPMDLTPGLRRRGWAAASVVTSSRLFRQAASIAGPGFCGTCESQYGWTIVARQSPVENARQGSVFLVTAFGSSHGKVLLFRRDGRFCKIETKMCQYA